MIHNKNTAKERWALSFSKAALTAFVPDLKTTPKDPFMPLAVTVKHTETARATFGKSGWTRVDLEVKVSFPTSDQKDRVLREMGEIQMKLDPEFRPSIQTDELFHFLPKGSPTPGMDLPQIAYGGPPLESHLYPVGGTSMNYVRNLLEYLVSNELLKDSGGNELNSIPQTFENEFGRYREIWMKHWGDTKEGKEIIAAVHQHVRGTR